MKYISIILCTLITTTAFAQHKCKPGYQCVPTMSSFTGHKCEHVFVEVEQANIKVEQPELSIGSMIYQPYGWPTGLREGKELVCVKCFHIQRQILDYGKPASGTLTWPRGSVINAGPCYDTLFTIPKGGWLQVDTSIIIHSK